MNKWIMQENNTKSENQIKLLKTWIKVPNKEQQYLKRRSCGWMHKNNNLEALRNSSEGLEVLKT